MPPPPAVASVKVVEAVGKHTGTVIFLHGLGDQGTSFVPLARVLGQQFPNLKFILPSAKSIPITMNSGYRMPGWFDIPTLSNLTSDSRKMDDEPGLMKSVDSLDQLIAQEIESCEIPEESIVIGGFSQGSVISLLTGITSKRKLAGVVALSGWVPLNHKVAEIASPHAKDLAVFWGHGSDDQVVKFSFGLKSVELLQSIPQINLPLLPPNQKFGKPGLTFRKYEGMPHSLIKEEIDDLGDWLQGITFDVWTASHRKSLASSKQARSGSNVGHQTFPSASQVMNRVSKMSRGYSTRSTSGSGSRSDSVSVPTPVSTGSSTAVQQSPVTPATSEYIKTPASSAPNDLKTSAASTVETPTTAIAAPPKTWLDRLPSALQPMKPYLELTRIDKPIGTWLLYWPCAWSITLSTLTMTPLPSPLVPLYNLALFLTGAFVMRGAGCTINDMWDARLDRAVDRTRSRPLARGAVSMQGAALFLVGQLLVGLAVLVQLNWYSILLGASSLGLVFIYPFMKRVTYYPQVVLGLAFNWGALLGWSAMAGTVSWPIAGPLYLGGVIWCVYYDTIYAHQDKKDDILVNIKSTALRFGSATRPILAGLSTAFVGSLTYVGQAMGLGPIYYSVSVVGTAIHLGWQLLTVDFDKRESCWKSFVENGRLGGYIWSGMWAEYIATWMGIY